jgi:hypothetical protein
MARDLIEALHFLMVLKLDNNLRQRRSASRSATWCSCRRSARSSAT